MAKKGESVESSDNGGQGPVEFVEEVLRDRPYDKQKEILRAVKRRRRVSVVGCNGSGKD